MSVVDDLLAALGEGIQAAGPGEVDKPGPASTRGTADGSGANGRRQKSNRLVVERVETCPPWPTSWDPMNPWPTWDRWRAEVARQQIAKDAAAGAASAPRIPDSDEVELEQQRTWEWLHVRDGEGVEWLNVPPFELDDLPQPVTVLERTTSRVYREKPKVAPVVKLAKAKVKKHAGPPQKMTQAQIDRHLDRIDRGEGVMTVARSIWKTYGFASAASCETSLRRQRALRDAAQREEIAA